MAQLSQTVHHLLLILDSTGFALHRIELSDQVQDFSALLGIALLDIDELPVFPCGPCPWRSFYPSLVCTITTVRAIALSSSSMNRSPAVIGDRLSQSIRELAWKVRQALGERSEYLGGMGLNIPVGCCHPAEKAVI